MNEATTKNDPFGALRYKDYRLYIGVRFFITLAVQVNSVVICWQIYRYTKDELALGMIGLAEVVPFLITSFFSGYVADTYNRKMIIVFSISTAILSTIGLLSFALHPELFNKTGRLAIYGIIGFMGIIRGFVAATMMPFMTQLVPRNLYANASSWNISVLQTAALMGPSVAGLLCIIGFPAAYKASLLFLVVAIGCVLSIPSRPVPPKVKKESVKESLLGGLKFIFNRRVLLNVILLDLFVVLFGDMTAMMPVFADRVYHIGTVQLGLLSSMPALGGILTGFILAYKPPAAHAGRNLILAVACLGITTILFALNTSYYFALLLFLLIGSFDDVITVTRHTIIQLSTPDHMRGRVSAVGSIFNGSSVEISAFESGVAAKLIGLAPSVAFGGMMTLIVAAITFKAAPKLRKMDIGQIRQEAEIEVEAAKLVV